MKFQRGMAPSNNNLDSLGCGVQQPNYPEVPKRRVEICQLHCGSAAVNGGCVGGAEQSPHFQWLTQMKVVQKQVLEPVREVERICRKPRPHISIRILDCGRKAQEKGRSRNHSLQDPSVYLIFCAPNGKEIFQPFQSRSPHVIQHSFIRPRLEIKRAIVYTWTPKVCKITAQTTKNSLQGHYCTYIWGSGTAYI